MPYLFENQPVKKSKVFSKKLLPFLVSSTPNKIHDMKQDTTTTTVTIYPASLLILDLPCRPDHW